MSRGAVALALAAAVLVPLAARAALPRPVAAAGAHVAHPDAALVGLRLDYVRPPAAAGGGVASFAPLVAAATGASVDDVESLAYRSPGDLGGFLPAPVGRLPLSGGGRTIVTVARLVPELPLYRRAAGGRIASFTGAVAGGRAAPPDNGGRPVAHLGVPVPPPPPASGNVPPANQDFGGRPPRHGGGGTTTRPRRRPKPPPQPPAATTTATTTAPPATTAAPAPAAPAATAPAPVTTTPRAACGVPGLEITSDHATCAIDAAGMAPGDSASEVMTFTNTSGSPYTLSLQAGGTQNQLWNDLRMGVWQQGTPAPTPLPPLLYWTTGFNALATLQPGDSVSYVIELYLPTTAGNADQSLQAVVDFTWRAG